jgi:phosphoribosyl-ATP pyrophosphohydrolase
MPTSHNALKTILEGIEKRIAEDEARLLGAATDQDRTRLIEEITDLKMRQKEIKHALLGDGDD